MTTRPDQGASPPACRGCGGPFTRYRGSKHSRFLGRDFSFWRCQACDLTFVDPFPGYGAYDDAYYLGTGADPHVDYESEYRDYRSTPRLGELLDLWRVASGFIERNLVPGPVEWLDFGCGSGGLLKFLADTRGHASSRGSWTLDLSGHDIGSFADRLRADGMRILTAEALRSLPAGAFDVISMIEVVEHIEYPDPVFALVARLLKPGGLLLLTTGNVASPAARLQGLRYGYFMPEVHVSYFTPRALRALYHRHGLVPVNFRLDGCVRFKVVKTLLRPGLRRAATFAMRFPGVVRAIDLLFGASAMPSATRPL